VRRFCGGALLVAGTIALASAGGAAAAARPSEGYLEASEQVELYYRTLGTADATMVVLHGGPGLDHAYLLPDLEPLADFHTLVYYDQRGGGRSTLVADGAELDLQAHVEDLDAVRRELEIERTVILGHSWGAVLAAHYARAYPQHVEKLVMVSPGAVRRTPYEDELFARAIAWMNDAELAELEALTKKFQAGAGDIRATCRAFFGLYMRGGFFDPRGRTAMRNMRGDFCAAPEQALRNMWAVSDRTMDSLGDFDWRGDFGELEIPVLVLAGAADAIPVENFHEWQAAFPDARLVLLEEAAHFPHVEQPAAFFHAVAEFLR
jgi:proline iminopeptidase